MPYLPLVILAAASALLVACGPKPSKSGEPDVPSVASFKMVEKDIVLQRLKDPQSAVFSGEFMSQNATGAPTFCGYVNSRNGFGGMTGPQRFIAGAVAAFEADMAPGEMDNAWSLLCSNPIAE